MTVANASRAAKTIADPIAEYESLLPVWKRARAVCGGEASVKAYDGVVDVATFKNMLIPFSPSMSQQQYSFYRAEAELPGITCEFAKMLLGGLLRKEPVVKLPESLPEDALDWITTSFSQDDASLVSFLDEAIWEELQTSRAWVYIDYPAVGNAADLTPDERAEVKPYPVLWKAEEVINTRVGPNKMGKLSLQLIITRGLEEFEVPGEVHPKLRDTIRIHEIHNGLFRVRVYRAEEETNQVPTVGGQRIHNTRNKPKFEFVEVLSNFLVNGKPLDFIPAWPLNGQLKFQTPMLASIIDKEVALYNKMSRRNHLLYGAATYTPVISSDMDDDTFDTIVTRGLGSWLKIGQGDAATVLDTPTAALADMDRAIAAGIEEMAKLGIRMLSPEAAQSGVALELRNAAQTARLGFLASKISRVMEQIIAFMIEWRYGVELETTDVKFTLSEDFSPMPAGVDWLRLATEWYQQGLIPRSVWLVLLKLNDMLPPDYDDEDGAVEIEKDQEVALSRQNDAYASQLTAQMSVQESFNKEKDEEASKTGRPKGK